MSSKSDFNPVKAYILLFLVLLWTFFSLALYGLLAIIPFVNQRFLIPIYHTVMCFLMGVKIVTKGKQSSEQSTLFVSNHVSYLDIPVLGKLIKAGFVAKSEIASWPLISLLARLQDSIFIERKPSKAKSQMQILRQHLEEGNSLILFPEGTSTNGAQVLPLKSSLFSAAESQKAEIIIQPVSVVYSEHNGKGMDQVLRDHFAWYADFPFGAHFVKMLGMGTITAVITFNEPIRLSDYSSRKECAMACEEIMRNSFDDAFISSGSTRGD